MIQRTLVGYDRSESAQRAFRFALDMMRASGGRVRVLAVQKVAEVGPDVAMMMTGQGEDYSREVVSELTALAPGDADLWDLRVVYGSPGDALLAELEAFGGQHLVIGHSERGALLRWLLGSVSSELLSRAPVPVTVVR